MTTVYSLALEINFYMNALVRGRSNEVRERAGESKEEEKASGWWKHGCGIGSVVNDGGEKIRDWLEIVGYKIELPRKC